MLDEMTEDNPSKLATFLEYENPYFFFLQGYYIIFFRPTLTNTYLENLVKGEK